MSLSNTNKPVLILGESNINKIPQFHHTNPGWQADFQQNMDKTPTHPDTKLLILSVGTNNRDQDPNKTSIKQLRALCRRAGSTFPNAEIRILIINYSTHLIGEQQHNLTTINNYIRSHLSHLPPLPPVQNLWRQNSLDTGQGRESILPLVQTFGLQSPSPLSGPPHTPWTDMDLSWESRAAYLTCPHYSYRQQVSLLERGHSFQNLNMELLRNDLHAYHRKLKLTDYFKNNNTAHLPFTAQSIWEPARTLLCTPPGQCTEEKFALVFLFPNLNPNP